MSLDDPHRNSFIGSHPHPHHTPTVIDVVGFCTPSCYAHGSCWRREAGLTPEVGCTYGEQDDDPGLSDW